MFSRWDRSFNTALQIWET